MSAGGPVSWSSPWPRDGYRSWWLRFWATGVVIFSASSLLLWPVATVAGTFLAAAITAVMILLRPRLAHDDHDHRPGAGSRSHRVDSQRVTGPSWGQVFERATWAGGSTVAVCAVSAAVPSLGVSLLLVAVLSSPWFLTAISRHVRPREVAGQPVDDPSVAASGSTQGRDLGVLLTVSFRSMSTPELCQAWRRSGVVIARSETPETYVLAAEPRRCLLEELSRRDPAAIQAWLTNGARAASGPERYLTRGAGADSGNTDTS